MATRPRALASPSQSVAAILVVLPVVTAPAVGSGVATVARVIA